MVYLYISEDVVNSYLMQLDTFGDLHLLLHKNDDFKKLLALECSKKRSCFGDFIEDSNIYNYETGLLYFVFKKKIFLSFQIILFIIYLFFAKLFKCNRLYRFSSL